MNCLDCNCNENTINKACVCLCHEFPFPKEWSKAIIGPSVRKASNGKMVPVIPALPEQDVDLDPNSIIAICGACGVEIRRVMMRSCPKSNCPIQPKAIL